MMYRIKKITFEGFQYYLSPRLCRWIPANSTKHRFGKFSEDDAKAFIESKRNDEPLNIFQLIPTP